MRVAFVPLWDDDELKCLMSNTPSSVGNIMVEDGGHILPGREDQSFLIRTVRGKDGIDSTKRGLLEGTASICEVNGGWQHFAIVNVFRRCAS